jgi:phosphatidylinositol kinase/protein kinase (PI-3  family)
MTSKKLPLWLVFENADSQGDDLYIIYKSGDDLRQDEMTLQVRLKCGDLDGLLTYGAPTRV